MHLLVPSDCSYSVCSSGNSTACKNHMISENREVPRQQVRDHCGQSASMSKRDECAKGPGTNSTLISPVASVSRRSINGRGKSTWSIWDTYVFSDEHTKYTDQYISASVDWWGDIFVPFRCAQMWQTRNVRAATKPLSSDVWRQIVWQARAMSRSSPSGTRMWMSPWIPLGRNTLCSPQPMWMSRCR